MVPPGPCRGLGAGPGAPAASHRPPPAPAQPPSSPPAPGWAAHGARAFRTWPSPGGGHAPALPATALPRNRARHTCSCLRNLSFRKRVAVGPPQLRSPPRAGAARAPMPHASPRPAQPGFLRCPFARGNVPEAVAGTDGQLHAPRMETPTGLCGLCPRAVSLQRGPSLRTPQC